MLLSVCYSEKLKFSFNPENINFSVSMLFKGNYIVAHSLMHLPKGLKDCLVQF